MTTQRLLKDYGAWGVASRMKRAGIDIWKISKRMSEEGFMAVIKDYEYLWEDE